MPWPKGKPSWNSGLKKETDDRVKKHAENLSVKFKGTRPPLSEEGKISLTEKSRNNILKRYAEGWESTAGRCKKCEYTSPIAGKIFVDGTWELKFCSYMDKMGYTWCRNKDRFHYVKPNGKHSMYRPDFFVKEWDSYVEIKGYETDIDRAKWQHFPKELKIKVLYKKDISELDEWLKSAPC